MIPVRGAARFMVPLLSLVSWGCLARTVPEQEFVQGDVPVQCCGRADEPVEITYLGVSGWVIRKGDNAVLTAPLFSNPSILEAGLLPIEADADRIEAHLPDVADVSGILVGHGHYDHLMDVPYIVRERAPRAVVYGNRTTAFQLAPFELGEGRVKAVDPSAGSTERMGVWIDVGSNIRIMPLVSNHAPHFAGHTLYSGVRTRPMRRAPRSAEEWLAGESLAFLIDVLNVDRSVALRIYFQDAVSAAPYGLGPPLDDSVGVDVALIVPATYAEVVWHPEAILDDLEPRHVILSHWENFFEPPSRPATPVPFTLLPDFVRRLRRALPEGSEWHLPLPGARFTFR